MKLFGLSSLDAMLLLLLLDGAWWTTVFLGQYVPILVHNVENMMSFKKGLDFTEVSILICGVILFLRFKAPLILLITVLKNRVNEHCQMLKIWYWVSIFLDLALVVLQVIFTILYSASNQHVPIFSWNSLVFYIASFLIFRGLLWSLARSMVKELGSTENTLFPVAGCRGVFNYLSTHVESLLKILVSFEILWNGILLLSFGVAIVLAHFFRLDGWEYNFGGLFPLKRFVGLSDLILPVYFLAVGGIQMLGIEKGWRTFLKVWVVVYMVGVAGFGFGIILDILGSFFYRSLVDHIINCLLGLCQLALKLILVISTFKYLREGKGSEEEGDNEVFMQPLLPKEILAGKDPKLQVEEQCE